LGKSDSDLRHGSEDSPSPHPEIKTIAANLSERSERLAGGDARGDSGFQVTNGRTTARRKLESMPSKQDDVDSESNARNLFEPQMRVVDFIQVINASGFGQVLTERNVRRLRRAFPTVDAGRGKINVAEFIAAMCSRRGRRRKTDELSIKDLELLLDAQEYRCALTGEPLTPENLAVDHIVPISEGGSFDAGNSQLVTKCVNRAKHTMSQHQFITLCQQVAESFRDH
jgi:5-methylcytosine-specific restriction endonuclease McrA